MVINLLIFLSFCSSDNNWSKSLNEEGLRNNVKSIKLICYKANLVDDVIKRTDRYYLNVSGEDLRIDFDKKGRKIIAKYCSSGNETTVHQYFYPDSETKIDSVLYNKRLLSVCSYKYKKSRNIVELVRSDTTNKIVDKETFIYNSSNRLIEEMVYSTNNELQLIINYNYNENGNLAELLQFFPDGSSIGRWEYSYNQDGDISDEYIYENDGRLNTNRIYKYKYDSKKNWIEKTYYTTNNGTPFRLDVKSIDYY